MIFLKFSKSGPGLVLGQFGLQIRILRENVYRVMGSDQFFIDFWWYPAGLGPGRSRAAISKLGFRNNEKISSRDQTWSLDHLACDQSSAGPNKTYFKSPELVCYCLVIFDRKIDFSPFYFELSYLKIWKIKNKYLKSYEKIKHR